MAQWSRRSLISFGLLYAVLIWVGAQPLLIDRVTPLLWMAGGFAAGGILLVGKRLLPVILAGALAGYGAVLWQLGLPSEHLLIVVSAFVLSAGGHAWLADWLVRRFGRTLPPSSIRYTLVVCGLLALAALPAPFVVVAVLMAVQHPLVNSPLIVALQWWLNLVAGVWLVTPWIVVGEYYRQRRPMREPWLWPVSSLLLAFMLFSLQLIWRDANRQFTIQLQADVNEVVSLINDRMTIYEQALLSQSALFLASQQVDQHEFSVFGRTQLARLPALRAVGWIPRIPLAQRTAFEHAMQETGLPDFRIREPGATARPADTRDEYYPLTYLEPFARRRAVLGLDLAADPVRRAAIEQARDSGQIVITAPLQSYLASDPIPAVLLFAPVYGGSLPPQSVEERRQRIRGMVAFLIVPGEVIEQALRPVTTPDLEFVLVDATEESLQPLAVFTGGRAIPIPYISDLDIFIRDAVAISDIPRYGRVWSIAFRPGAGYSNVWLSEDAVSRTVLAIASVAIFFLFVAIRQRHEVRQRRLTRTYALLSAINQMIIRERDPQRIFQEVCQVGIGEGGFRLVWIGRHNPVTNRCETIAIHSAMGLDQSLVQLLTGEQLAKTLSPVFQGEQVIINDLATDPRCAAWCSQAVAYGLRAMAGFPLVVPDEAPAVLCFCAGQTAVFNHDEIQLLDELVRDIVFGLLVSQQEAQLRASEQRNHLIVSALPDLVLRLRPDGQVIDVVAAESMVLPMAPTAMINRTLEQLFPAAIATQYRQALSAAFASGELQTLAYQLIVEDKEYFFEARIKAALPAEEAIAIVRDVTAWRHAELALQVERDLLAQRVAERTAELHRANAELLRAARTKDEFLANMSHELRTPLNSILALSESLLEELYGPLREQQQKAIRAIEASGRHLLALINDVLDLAKIEANRIELVKEVVAASDVCEASVALVKEQATKKQIHLSVQLDDPHARFVADPRRLKQILVNLLSNAVKFTPAGGAVSLQVTTDIAQGTIAFTVSDTGIGIAEEDLPRLFQPFVQLDSGLSRQHEGTGLGLVLVRRLVELHGGRVEVESTPGVGSRFTVTLPYQPVTHVTASSSTDELPPVQLALIIEDSATTADQLARYLEELQIQPVICSYGKGAVEQVQALRPDLILLDVQMPDRSGWEILADLRRDPDLRQIPVIIVSVVDEPERGLAAGAAAYLVKPINRLMLRRALSQITVAKTTSSTAPRRTLSRRILLAEDNEVNRVTLSDYLVAQGYEVRVACHGQEALQIAAEWCPDLIIMDIQMPGLDGLEAIQRLRADAIFATTPIIAVTALAMPGDRERCLSAGASDYFAKPIRLRQLVERIEQLLVSSQHAV
ncbi:MAG: histidine kinase [Chloroflexus sp.]|nr:MAG: histidine kinase [Chloroflexus sp.]